MDTLRDLISYTKPKHNLLVGGGFVTSNLFKIVYDYTLPRPYDQISIVSNDERIINYSGKFHVFVATNHGEVLATADASWVSIDFGMSIERMEFKKIRIEIDTVTIQHCAYSVFLETNINTYLINDADPVRTLFIILIEREDNIYDKSY